MQSEGPSTSSPEQRTLLRLSAPLALATAAHTCRVDPRTRETCSWYHGPWQYFRLFGVVGDPLMHATMFAPVLLASARDGRHPRVLICGGADYAVLDLVHAAYAQMSATLAVSMIDVCPTPLRLCEWYAHTRGFTLTTEVGDILAFDDRAAYDLICTHAFLGYFDAAERVLLARRWHALLRPGGRLITVQRLRPGQVGTARFSVAQTTAFHAQVLAAAERETDLGARTAADFGAMADAFSARFHSHPLQSRDEIDALLSDAGFHFETLAVHASETASEAAPSLPGGALYAQVVAVRN